MRWFSLLLFVVFLSATLQAHHPNKECQDVHPRIDVIGPIGNRLPMSYRRRYNRPTNLGGKIAYHIAPSSQEAMAWHEATHNGAYSQHRGRIEKHFFYPKPWEALRVGPRKATSEELPADYQPDLGELGEVEEFPVEQLSPPDEEPLANETGLIEE
jgi:hypothetical protein